MADLSRLEHVLRRMPRWQVLTACFVMLVSLAALDLAVGPQIRLYLLYWLPVAVASWCCGRRIGASSAAVGALAWLVVNRSEYRYPDEVAILAWNGLVTAVSLVLIALLIGALRSHVDAAVKLSRLDPLTGLATSRVWEERLERELRRAERTGTPTTVIYLDIDDFKLVNDRFGHAHGDQVLRALARVIEESIRELDTVARLGGDEFAVLAAGCPVDAAEKLAQRILSLTSKLIARRCWPIGLSAGVVTCTRPGCSAAELTHAADSLMYEVKRAGKGAVRSARLI